MLEISHVVGLSEQLNGIYVAHGVHVYHKLTKTLRPKLIQMTKPHVNNIPHPMSRWPRSHLHRQDQAAIKAEVYKMETWITQLEQVIPVWPQIIQFPSIVLKFWTKKNDGSAKQNKGCHFYQTLSTYDEAGLKISTVPHRQPAHSDLGHYLRNQPKITWMHEQVL